MYEIKAVTLQQNCLSNTNIGYTASREEVKIDTCGLLCTHCHLKDILHKVEEKNSKGETNHDDQP